MWQDPEGDLRPSVLKMEAAASAGPARAEQTPAFVLLGLVLVLGAMLAFFLFGDRGGGRATRSRLRSSSHELLNVEPGAEEGGVEVAGSIKGDRP